jgi:hypothetical protein
VSSLAAAKAKCLKGISEVSSELEKMASCLASKADKPDKLKIFSYKIIGSSFIKTQS